MFWKLKGIIFILKKACSFFRMKPRYLKHIEQINIWGKQRSTREKTTLSGR